MMGCERGLCVSRALAVVGGTEAVVPAQVSREENGSEKSNPRSWVGVDATAAATSNFLDVLSSDLSCVCKSEELVPGTRPEDLA